MNCSVAWIVCEKETGTYMQRPKPGLNRVHSGLCSNMRNQYHQVDRLRAKDLIGQPDVLES
jgi:hypothetical protein